MKSILRVCSSFLLLALILPSLASCVKVSKKVAGEKATKFLSENYLPAGYTAKLVDPAKDVVDKNGVFEVNIEISTPQYAQKQMSKVTISHDGRYFAQQGMRDMSKPLIPKQAKPLVQLFVMSACPYGVIAENTIAPAIEALGDKIDFVPFYIINSYPVGPNADKYCTDPNGKYCSMHGTDEAKEDGRQLCIFKNQKNKYWSYLKNFNELCYNSRDLSQGCFERAANMTGVDIEGVNKCFNGPEMATMFDEQKAAMEKYGAEGSPTIIINGEKYNGERSANGFLKAICKGFTKAPKECDQQLVESASANSPMAAGGGCGN